MIGKRISRDEASSNRKQIWLATATLIVVALILSLIASHTSTGVKKKEKKKENKKVEIYTEPTDSFGGDVIPTAMDPEFETVEGDDT